MTDQPSGVRQLVPLYVHPTVDPAAWRAVAAAGPHRIGAVVLNVAGGPGPLPDQAFTAAAASLRDAGIPLLGYTDTAQGRRPHPAVIADLLNHRQWYAVDGVYFDQVSGHPAAIEHYRRLATAARAAGCGTVVFGHGSHPDPGYATVGLADCLVTFEGDWEDYAHLALPLWTRRHPPARFCHLIHGVPPDRLGEAVRLFPSRGAAFGCAVSASGPAPWAAVPFLFPGRIAAETAM